MTTYEQKLRKARKALYDAAVEYYMAPDKKGTSYEEAMTTVDNLETAALKFASVYLDRVEPGKVK